MEAKPTPPQYSSDDYDFLNELAKNIPESYDADEAMEAIVLRYVRALEGVAMTHLGYIPEAYEEFELRGQAVRPTNS